MLYINAQVKLIQYNFGFSNSFISHMGNWMLKGSYCWISSWGGGRGCGFCYKSKCWGRNYLISLLNTRHFGSQEYQDQSKCLEQKTQDSTRIAEVQEMISSFLFFFMGNLERFHSNKRCTNKAGSLLIQQIFTKNILNTRGRDSLPYFWLARAFSF